MGKNKDVAWKHCQEIPGNKNGTICNYCGAIFNGGGITRFKHHIAGGNVNVEMCRKQGKKVRDLFRNMVDNAKLKKLNKAVAQREYEEAMCNTQDVSDSDDEFETQHQGYDLDDLEQARRASLASHHNENQLHRGGSLRMEVGEGSCSKKKGKGKMGSLFRRSSSMRAGKQPDIATIDVDLIRREDTKQPSIKQSFKAGSRALGDQFRTFFGKFIHYAAINPHQAIANPYTQPMIDAACRAGLGVKPPSAYDLFHKELDIIYLEVEEYIEALRSKWATYGVTVMCDGWTGPTRKSLMNFLVYCDGQCCYVRSVNVSKDYKDHILIMDHMKSVVNWVGKENVVQIVTDNGPNYKKAGEQLARLPGYNLFWSGCAAHSIDLILKDFCKRASVLKLIKKAKVVVTYLYNHSRVCELMRRLCGGDIVRPALTRFATNFLALQSMWNKKDGLKAMIVHEDWVAIRGRGNKKMEKLEDIINERQFWRDVKILVDCMEPLVETLRLVDADTKPTMGFLHRWMSMMKKKIESTKRYPEWVIRLIDRRWTKNLSHTLHLAAYYLNPVIQYGPERPVVTIDPILIKAVQDAIGVLVPDIATQTLCLSEIKSFREAHGTFGRPTALHSRTSEMPAEWWTLHGGDAPNLRAVAIKILSQTVASSGCERNWSTFGMVHSDRRCRLADDTLHKLVYVHYNLRLKAKNLRLQIFKTSIPNLDLTQLYPASDGEDAPFDWIQDDEGSEPELDEDGRPNAYIAHEMRVEVEENLVPPPRHEDALDDTLPPSERNDEPIIGDGSDLFASSSGSDDDGGSGSGGGGGGGGDGATSLQGVGVNEGSEMEVMPPLRFTGESEFQYATQDEDHAGTASRMPKSKRVRQRRPHPNVETAESANWSNPSSEGYTSGYSYAGRQDNQVGGLFDWNTPQNYYPSEDYSSSTPSYAYGKLPAGYNSSSSHGQIPQASSDYGYSSGSYAVSHRGGGEQWFPAQLQEWLNPLTGDIEMAVASISSPITEKLGYPIIGFLVTGCPDQVTYDGHVRDFFNLYRRSMTWIQYCNSFLPSLATQVVYGGQNIEAGRSSFWG